MTCNDVEYYLARAQEERQRAAASADPRIAEIHRQLAELCAERATMLAAGVAVPGPKCG